MKKSQQSKPKSKPPTGHAEKQEPAKFGHQHGNAAHHPRLERPVADSLNRFLVETVTEALYYADIFCQAVDIDDDT